MSQAVFLENEPRGSGLLLGGGCYVLHAEGDPNERTDKLLTAVRKGNGDSLSLGTLFIDTAGGVVYVKTAAIDPDHPSGLWQVIQVR